MENIAFQISLSVKHACAHKARWRCPPLFLIYASNLVTMFGEKYARAFAVMLQMEF
jgi:hypothetical protein